MRKVLIVCLGLLMLPACGDNINPNTSDDDVEIDANPLIPDAEPEPDAMVCDPRGFGEIGGSCDSNDDCGARPDSFCYVGVAGPVTFAPEGYCMDDDFSMALGTCASNTDCPTGTECTEWLDFAGYKSCMPTCACANSGCPEHQTCMDSFNGLALDRDVCVPGDQNAVDGDACDGFFACDEQATCFNDVEYPGGECEQYGCTLGDDTTCNGGVCAADIDPPLSGNPTCEDACVDNADCRTAEGYVCFDPDGAGTAAKYCRHPHIGDACTSAADCGGGLWVCKTGATFPGGSCAMTGCPTPGSSEGCTDGSVCFDDPLDATNYCVDRCEGIIGMQGTCRAGYSCRDMDPGVGSIVGGCTL